MVEYVKHLVEAEEVTGLDAMSSCPSLLCEGGVHKADMEASQRIQIHLLGIGERLRQHVAAVGHRFDFTPQQAMLLDRLGTRQSMSQVAEALHCDPSNVTGLIRRLEQRGLVIREVDDADRRTKWLVLTPAGIAARESLLHELFQRLPVLDALDDAAQEQLLNLLRAVVGNLKAGPACG